MYIALVAIPEQKWQGALDMLLSDRQPDPTNGYQGYDGEIHFSNLTSKRAVELAKRWLS